MNDTKIIGKKDNFNNGGDMVVDLVGIDLNISNKKEER